MALTAADVLIGLLGTKPSQEALEECDTLLMVGTSFPYIEFLPKPGQARGVQIELDPMRIGLRYPVEVGLVGDSARTLQALLLLLTRKTEREFLEPPLPAKVTLDQAAKFAKSLLQGEPNSQKIELTVLGQRIRELV